MVSSHSSMTSTKKTRDRYSSGGRESSKDSDNSSDESEDESEEEGRRKKGVKETPEVRHTRRQWKRNYYLAV